MLTFYVRKFNEFFFFFNNNNINQLFENCFFQSEDTERRKKKKSKDKDKDKMDKADRKKKRGLKKEEKKKRDELEEFLNGSNSYSNVDTAYEAI